MYGILQLSQGSHLDNFSPKTLKLGWVAFHPRKCQLKCLDFQSNQYKKLAPVLSRFWNGLFFLSHPSIHTILEGSLQLFCDWNVFRLTINWIIKPDCVLYSAETCNCHFSKCWHLTGDHSCVYRQTPFRLSIGLGKYKSRFDHQGRHWYRLIPSIGFSRNTAFQ